MKTYNIYLYNESQEEQIMSGDFDGVDMVSIDSDDLEIDYLANELWLNSGYDYFGITLAD